MIKKICALLTASIMVLPIKAKEGEIIKTGWNFGPLPVVGLTQTWVSSTEYAVTYSTTATAPTTPSMTTRST